MYKLLFSLFICSTIIFSSDHAISLMDIDDAAKDKDIHIQYLPQYIKTIYESRTQYLKEKIEHLKDDRNPFVHLGENRWGAQVYTDHASRLPEDSTSAHLQQLSLTSYQNQLKFFDHDPFILHKNPRELMKIDISDPIDLSVYYVHTNAMLTNVHRALRANLITSPTDPLEAHLLEPLFLEEESAIGDLIAIIRAIRPHLPQVGKMETGAQKNRQKGDKILRDLAFNERLYTLYQWKSILERPEILQEVLKGIDALERKKLPDNFNIEAQVLKEDSTEKSKQSVAGRAGLRGWN